MTDDEFYTVDDIAKRLKVNPETVRRWLRTGELKGFQFAPKSSYRVPASVLSAFIDRHCGSTEGRGSSRMMNKMDHSGSGGG